MSTALAIFVKTPWVSPLKTRLAQGIGQARALEFYHLSLKAIEQTVKHCDVEPYWAVAEKESVNDPLWSSFPALYTGEGGLGERQYRMYRALLSEHDRVILIGADVPQITMQTIHKAIFCMDGHDFVMGPSQDGGYYLFGGRLELEKKIWTSVEYSVESTRADLMEQLPSTPYLLKPLTDVDYKKDLKTMVNEMPPQMSTAQDGIARWFKALDI